MEAEQSDGDDDRYSSNAQYVEIQEYLRRKSKFLVLLTLSDVLFCFLGICVSRWRGSENKKENTWIAKTTASTIHQAGIVPFCKEILHVLRPTWKG